MHTVLGFQEPLPTSLAPCVTCILSSQTFLHTFSKFREFSRYFVHPTLCFACRMVGSSFCQLPRRGSGVGVWKRPAQSGSSSAGLGSWGEFSRPSAPEWYHKRRTVTHVSWDPSPLTHCVSFSFSRPSTCSEFLKKVNSRPEKSKNRLGPSGLGSGGETREQSKVRGSNTEIVWRRARTPDGVALHPWKNCTFVPVSSRTHSKNVPVRLSWSELHRNRPLPSAAAEARCLEGYVRATGHLLGFCPVHTRESLAAPNIEYDYLTRKTGRK